MQLFHKYHIHEMHKLFYTKFHLFELSIWLHVFGRSMISIFIPIFLLKIGYSIPSVLVFYLIYNIFDFPLNFVAKWLIEKIGGRRVLMIGTLSIILFFLGLYSLEFGNWMMFVIMAFLFAVYDACYWVAHLYLFMICSKERASTSRDTSILYIAKRIAGVLSPLFGALILIFFSKSILIVISIIILLLSIWPLFKIKNIKDKPDKRKNTSMHKFFASVKDARAHILYGLLSFHNVAEGIIWPIFIYTVFKSFESVAIIPILVSLTAIFFSYFTGKVKKSNRGKVISIAAFFISIIWILRLVLDSSIFYYASIVLIGLFSIMITLPIDAEIFEKGEEKDPLAASTYRNAFSMFPRIFFYSFLILFLNVFNISFIVAAISLFAMVFITFFILYKKRPQIVK